MVLGFWEIPEDEQPPEHIYGDDEALVEWFEGVKAARDEKYGTKPADQLEEVPLMRNELPIW